jgi:peptidoglycan hydrolase CwlO-like protein
MSRNILIVVLLLAIVVSAAIGYTVITQKPNTSPTIDTNDNVLTNGNVNSDVNSSFIDENQDIEIGEMV